MNTYVPKLFAESKITENLVEWSNNHYNKVTFTNTNCNHKSAFSYGQGFRIKKSGPIAHMEKHFFC
jgi:hypothetical protein